MSLPCSWTYEDDIVLIEGWGILPDEEIARRAHHPERACSRRASILGIYKRRRYRSPGALARALATHPNTVLNWIKCGWLKAERSPVRSYAGFMWHIPDQALGDFLLQHPVWAERARQQYKLAASVKREPGGLEEEEWAA
jgi:hypothetical protein